MTDQGSPAEPLVSVIIPAYNAGPFLREAVESALAQTYPHVEVLVVDDGSTDETPAILRGYGARLRVLRQANQGVAVARNRGLAAARGALLAFLDADDAWLPEKLAWQVAEALAHPEAGLITCGTYYIDAQGTVFAERRPNGFPDRARTFQAFLVRNMIYGGPSTVLVPKRCLDAVGPFNPTLPPAEDWELWIRLARRFPVRSVDRFLSRYRVHTGNSHKRVERMVRGQGLVLETYRTTMSWMSARKALSAVHGDAAAEYCDMGRKALASRHVARAIWSYPLRVWPGDDKYLVAIKSALPDWTVAAARSLRRRFRPLQGG